MITEIAILNVKPTLETSFEKDFAKASIYISGIQGYISHSLKKCIEIKNQYLLTVHWKTLENHTVDFRTSDAYLEWKTLLHHYYDPFPTVLHYEDIELNKQKQAQQQQQQ